MLTVFEDSTDFAKIAKQTYVMPQTNFGFYASLFGLVAIVHFILLARCKSFNSIYL